MHILLNKIFRNIFSFRIAAQIGSVSALGVGGCWFESNLSEKPLEEPPDELA